MQISKEADGRFRVDDCVFDTADEAMSYAALRSKATRTGASETQRWVKEDSEQAPFPMSAPPPEVPTKPFKWWLWIPVGAVVAFFLIGVMAGNSPEAKEKQAARDAIAVCWKDQERKSHTPGTARFVATVCESMEKAFREKYLSSP